MPLPVGQGEHEARRHHGQDHDVEREAVALTRRVGETGIHGRQGVLPGAEPHGQHGRRRQDDQRRHELEPAGVERDRGDHADRERDPGTSAEGEEERRRQDRDARSREGAPVRTMCPGRKSESEEDPECREDPDRVPVSERFGEPVAGEPVDRPVAFWEEPRGEPVARCGGDTEQNATQEEGNRSSTDDEESRGRRRHVHDQALRLPDRAGRAPRPCDRQGSPGEQSEQRSDQDEVGPFKRRPARDDDPRRSDPEQRQRTPTPGRREVAAARRGETTDGSTAEHEGQPLVPEACQVDRNPVSPGGRLALGSGEV